jgi:phosphoserine phosphatase RsbU/P
VVSAWEAGIRDPSRIAALERSGLLESGPEDPFDRLTELAAEIIGAPWTCITLVDANRYVFKSAVGIPEGAAQPGFVEQSFCRYVVGLGQPLIVEDAPNDPRTCDNPAIELLGIAAWAGYPIEDANGAVLGTFCAVDTSPRVWRDLDIRVLATLARAVSTEIALDEARRAVVTAREEADALRSLLEGQGIG